ncbi:diacylglycerol/lipid kinase family protein [Olsenella urininfantis]|uniref:diacylglycerol/lipid kinase family protein n=1 Tax=Olsenella urininfantis TaxID=1871033 RepID=UPI000987A74D|nr:diacylglycerol kinase family protein [Olsenella urininfantis]
MANHQLGRTLVVANPASHSGKGAQAAERVRRFFESYASVSTSFDMRLTEAPGHATELAREAAGMDTLIVLGGDGVIHESVEGLMGLGADARPRLAVIPMGSGNDFARTISASYNDPERSLAEILMGSKRSIDLGYVANDRGEASYFVETLSFGLDAAIAHDTTRRRANDTGQEGSLLFATSSVKIMSAGSKGYPSRLTIDAGEPSEQRSIILAVQNGPTYGGGFAVCPRANPTDGLLDICYNVKVPNVPHLLGLLGLARAGKHVHSRIIRTARARRIEVEFPEAEAPCQIDGEMLEGRRFQIEVVPHALDVMVPQACPW